MKINSISIPYSRYNGILTIQYLIFPTALILVPTRELALQTSAIVIEMAKHMKVGAMVTTGGTVLKDDIIRLSNPIHILVGTPGRVHDLADRGIANLSKCKIVVMDEADKLLSPEFQIGTCLLLHLITFIQVETTPAQY